MQILGFFGFLVLLALESRFSGIRQFIGQSAPASILHENISDRSTDKIGPRETIHRHNLRSHDVNPRRRRDFRD